MIIASLLVAAVAGAQEHPCKLTSGVSYWMRERYFGIDAERDAGDERQWVSKGPSDRCFRTPLRELEKPLARTWGYRYAIEEWGKLLSDDPRQWDTPKIAEIRTKIAALLGRDFATPGEAAAWWRENADYLTWSEPAGRMVVDEAAKLAKQPVTTHDVERTIRASDYWYFEARGDIREKNDDGTYVHGKAWTGDSHRVLMRFRIARSELEDRRAKETAYEDAVTGMVAQLARSDLGAQTEALLRGALTRLTGRTFDRQGWVSWWSAHRLDARLDAQGLRLITD